MELRDKSAAGLERYTVGEYLGQGTTSDVFKVVDVVTRKEYVLKQMSLDSMSPEEQMRVKKEILVMNDVDHPNVIKFRESFSGDNSVNIIMERCKYTLEELIERQREKGGGLPFPEETIIEWMAELLCGLAYLHSRRIVHRDIKTSNIFVTDKNHVKLGDFGVCTVLTNATTSAQSMIGTPLYFSPEVCASEAYDERSDVWSLGVVFYEMCTLRRPFEAEHLPGLIQQILSKDVEPFNTGLDSRFEDIVRKMLSKNTSDRPTVQDLIDYHLVVPLSHPSHPTQKPSRGRFIQQYYGPELVFSRERSRVDSSPVQSGDGQECEQRQKRGPSRETKPLPDKSKEKKNVVAQKKKSLKKGTSKVLDVEERVGALNRIRNARSKINMTELRENMLQKRLQLFGYANPLSNGDIPVIIEVQRELLISGESDSDSESSRSLSSSPSPSSGFINDIAAVIQKHSSGGSKIALAQLEGAASLLCQYKLMNYGLC